jgi:DNA-binding transcriptional MerR regulator
VLRFWETRFPQIKPLKRGGGRRYYRPDDVELLRSIRFLLYEEGMTIKGVQKMLREQGAPAVRAEPARVHEGARPDPPLTLRDAALPDPLLSELRHALEDLREAERLLEAARRR